MLVDDEKRFVGGGEGGGIVSSLRAFEADEKGQKS